MAQRGGKEPLGQRSHHTTARRRRELWFARRSCLHVSTISAQGLCKTVQMRRDINALANTAHALRAASTEDREPDRFAEMIQRAMDTGPVCT